MSAPSHSLRAMTFGLVKAIPSNEEVPAVPETPALAPEDFPRAIYVAGASSEIARAKHVMQRLREAGLVVTSTWIDTITSVGDANPMGAPREQRYIWSATDLNEVSQASIFYLLLPDKGVTTSGAYVELGYAAALQAIFEMARAAGAAPPEASRWLVCSGEERSIFTALCDHFETDDAAIDAIVTMVRSEHSAEG